MELMSAIFDTRDMYLVREDIIDMTAYRWYDITDYEGALTPELQDVDKKQFKHESKSLENDPNPKPLSEKFVSDSPALEGSRRTADVKKSRLFKSPLIMLLALDVRHLAAANHLLSTDSIMKEWTERSIHFRTTSFVINFFIRLAYLTLVYVFEMDRRWIAAIGGRSDLRVATTGWVYTHHL